MRNRDVEWLGAGRKGGLELAQPVGAPRDPVLKPSQRQGARSACRNGCKRQARDPSLARGCDPGGDKRLHGAVRRRSLVPHKIERPFLRAHMEAREGDEAGAMGG